MKGYFSEDSRFSVENTVTVYQKDLNCLCFLSLCCTSKLSVALLRPVSFGYCQTLNSVLGTVEFSVAQLVGNLGNISACPQVVHYLPSLGGQPGECLSLPTSIPLLTPHLVGNLGNVSALVIVRPSIVSLVL